MEKEKYIKHAEQIVDLVEGMTSSQWNRVKQVIDISFTSLTAQVEYRKPEHLEVLMKQSFIS